MTSLHEVMSTRVNNSGLPELDYSRQQRQKRLHHSISQHQIIQNVEFEYVKSTTK